MQDRPNAIELLEAVREFLAYEVVPACDDHRLKFRTLIAANVLAVAERQLRDGDDGLGAALARLRALDDGPDRAIPDADLTDAASPLAANRATQISTAEVERRLRALCAAIRAGSMDDGLPWQSACDFALWHVEAKLQVSNPRYLQRRVGSKVEEGEVRGVPAQYTGADRSGGSA